MPSLERLYQQFKDSPFVVLGIDIQEEGDKVASFVQRYGLTYPNLLDMDGEVSMLYKVRSTPAKFLLDKDGYIVGVALGYREWDTEEMKKIVEILMGS